MADEYTVDKCTGGTPTANDGTASNAFDNNEGTEWNSTSQPSWIKYDFGAGTTWRIERVRTKATVSTTDRKYDNFSIEGSNNDSDWDTLLTDNGAQTLDWETWDFANTTKYRYIRMTVTDTHAGTYTRLVEIEMMEKIYKNPEFLLNMMR